MRIAPVAAAIALLALADAAQAQTAGEVQQDAQRKWLVTVGGRIRLRPPYEGSARYRFVPIGVLQIHKVDTPYRFTPPDGGGVLALIDRRRIAFGPALRLRETRDDTGRFVGLRKVNLAVEPGVFLDLWPADWFRIRLEGRRGVTGHQGWVGDAGMDYVHTGGKWDYSIGPRIGFGDSAYMRSYFGVTLQEAARNPTINRAYDPPGGQRYTGVTAAASYRLDNHWRLTVDGTYQRLAKIPQASPVVQSLGAKNQAAGGVGLSYTFGL